MRMNKRYIIWIGLIFLWVFPVHGDTNTEYHKCILPAQDFNEVSDCIKLGKNGQLFIAQKYLRQLSFEKNTLASVYSEEEGWMYVNRKGRVIISGVAAMDNGADVFHGGLVRFSQNKKWGFADERGRIVVAPIYDGAMNFDNGLAKVCNGCRSTCAEPKCEHHLFTGGEWFYINTKGKIVKKTISKEVSYE
jgi:hypothetical protein